MSWVIGILLIIGIGVSIFFGWSISQTKNEERRKIIQDIQTEIKEKQNEFKNNHTGWDRKPATEEETNKHNIICRG